MIEKTTSTATALSLTSTTSISYNCVICFDEFDTDVKYPVVLPCGHTFICIECANRIDKCMECRMSLYAPEKTNNSDTTRPSTTTSGTCSYDSTKSNDSILSRWDIYEQRRKSRPIPSPSSPSSSPKGGVNGRKIVPIVNKKQKTRLPLPKNFVLLSLIEASLGLGLSNDGNDVDDDDDGNGSTKDTKQEKVNSIATYFELKVSSFWSYCCCKKGANDDVDTTSDQNDDENNNDQGDA